MTALIFVWWVFSAHVSPQPWPLSPAFPDKVSCEDALKTADPFLPGKTACWPAPWKTELPSPYDTPQPAQPKHEGGDDGRID